MVPFSSLFYHNSIVNLHSLEMYVWEFFDTWGKNSSTEGLPLLLLLIWGHHDQEPLLNQIFSLWFWGPHKLNCPGRPFLFHPIWRLFRIHTPPLPYSYFLAHKWRTPILVGPTFMWWFLIYLPPCSGLRFALSDVSKPLELRF